MSLTGMSWKNVLFLLLFIQIRVMYGDVIWQNRIQYLVNKLGCVQTELLRIIMGDTTLTLLETFYLSTVLETLSFRKDKHRLIVLHYIINMDSHSYLCNLVPNLVRYPHGHFTQQDY